MWESAEPPTTAQVVVGRAIQDLAAARLGRGFVPLALLCLLGIGDLVAKGVASRGLALALGAPLCAAAMLAYGLRVVQRAFARPRRPWMVAAGIVGVGPPAFGLWVFGWLGLRGIAIGGGWGATVTGVLLTLLGLWLLRAWLRVVELQRLAEVMTMGFPANRGEQE